jgi:hypothetical protein
VRPGTEQGRGNHGADTTLFEKVGTPGADNRGEMTFVLAGLGLKLEDASGERA